MIAPSLIMVEKKVVRHSSTSLYQLSYLAGGTPTRVGLEPTTHGLSIEVTLQITTTISKEGKARREQNVNLTCTK